MGCAGGAGQGTRGLEPLHVSLLSPSMTKKSNNSTRDKLHALGMGAQLLHLGPFYVRMDRQCGVHLHREL